MADPTAAERPPTKDEMRILRHYADGQQIKHIVAMAQAQRWPIGQDTEEVRAVIDEWTGFTRQRAKDVVRRWWLLCEQQPEVNPSAEPPPVHHKSAPPPLESGTGHGPLADAAPGSSPAPAGAASADGSGLRPSPATGAGEVGATSSQPAPVAAPAKRAPRRPAATTLDRIGDGLELILVRAVKRGGEHGRRAGQLREQILALGAELDDLDRIAAQQKRVEELRRQLDAEEAKLRDLTSPGAPKQEEAAA